MRTGTFTRPNVMEPVQSARGATGLGVRVRVVGGVAARDRVPLAVAAPRARRQVLRRLHVDRPPRVVAGVLDSPCGPETGPTSPWGAAASAATSSRSSVL